MINIVHYIIVRRDLPLGICAAMITHAAGESGALYGDWIGGSAVVLGVDSEDSLYRLTDKLRDARKNGHDIQHVVIHESAAPYNGQLMAVGLVPQEKTVELAALMQNYLLLSELLPPAVDKDLTIHES